MNQGYLRSPGKSMARKASSDSSAISTRRGSPESTSTESSGSDPSSSTNTTLPSEGNETSWPKKPTSHHQSRGTSTFPYSHPSQDHHVSLSGVTGHGPIPLYVKIPTDPANLVATGHEMERAHSRLEQERRAARRADQLAAMDRTKQAQQDLVNAESSDDNLLSGRYRFDQILKDRKEGREAELRYVPEQSSSVRHELARAMDEAVQQLNGGRPSDEFELLDAIINHHNMFTPPRQRHDSSDSISSVRSQQTARPPPPLATLQPPFQAFPHPLPLQRQQPR